MLQVKELYHVCLHKRKQINWYIGKAEDWDGEILSPGEICVRGDKGMEAFFSAAFEFTFLEQSN